MNYPFNVESCHGIPYSWINEISWNLDLEPFGWPRTGKLKEFYKTELKRTNNEHPYQNIYKISGTILIYFDLHHSTFWFWPSLHLPKRFLAFWESWDLCMMFLQRFCEVCSLMFFHISLSFFFKFWPSGLDWHSNVIGLAFLRQRRRHATTA